MRLCIFNKVPDDIAAAAVVSCNRLGYLGCGMIRSLEYMLNSVGSHWRTLNDT